MIMPPAIRQCPECGAEVRRRHAKGAIPNFCGPECKKGYHNRSANEGRAIIALAKAWRAARTRKEDAAVGSAAMAEMVAIIDLLNAQDRKAGRPRPTEYAKALIYQGRYIDRKKA